MNSPAPEATTACDGVWMMLVPIAITRAVDPGIRVGALRWIDRVGNPLALHGLHRNGSASEGTHSRDDATTAEDVAEEVSEAAGAAKAFAQDKVQGYQAVMAERLDRATERIDSLETQATELAEGTRSRLQNIVDDLKARRDALQKDLDGVRVSSQSAWNDLKNDLDRSWTELDEAIESAVDRFDSEGADEQQPDPTKSSG